MIEKTRRGNVMIYRDKAETSTMQDLVDQLRNDFGAKWNTLTVVPNPMHNRFSAVLAVQIS